jgi:ADP-ribosylglycohydrolase
VNRFRGCLLGLAVGDAVGTTVEFSPPGSFAPVTDMVGGGHVVEALEAALWALAGALHGLEGIPAHWRERVLMRDEILAFADRLAP